LLGLLPTSIGKEVAPPILLSIEIGAFLAVIDFNERSSVFSDSLYESTRDCNLFLTMDFRDSALSPIISGKQWQDAFLFSNEQSRSDPWRLLVRFARQSRISCPFWAVLSQRKALSMENRWYPQHIPVGDVRSA
jgi:hypothetical protein